MKPTKVALGTPAPKFELPATDGQTYSSDDFSAPVLVVMFLCIIISTFVFSRGQQARDTRREMIFCV